MVQWFNSAGVRSVWQVVRQPGLLMPHVVVADIRSIPYEDLRARGIRYLVFDKDNCLTAPYAEHVHPPFADAWRRCRTLFPGAHVLIVSNSAGTADDRDRWAASQMEAALGVPVLRHRRKKPGCGDDVLVALGAMEDLAPCSIDPRHVAVVGDRLATDVALANINAMLAIWTTDIVSAAGDNAVASVARTIEHRLYGLLKRRGVRPPPHASGIGGR
ncbi:hypothetical protein GGH99_006189 [Coemansia sp. RSA 1285]|nr:hypothetical protein GGH99_006189 [Coemansia sp. RSA 1285]